MTDLANLIVSAIGAVGALAAAVIGVLVYLRQRSDSDPVVSAVLDQCEPGFWRVVLGVRNRSPFPWSGVEASIVRPRGGRLAPSDACLVQDSAGQPVFDPAHAKSRLAQTVSLALIVAPAGTPASDHMAYGSSSYHTEELLLFVPGSDRVSIAVTLRASDARARLKKIVVTRRLLPTTARQPA